MCLHPHTTCARYKSHSLRNGNILSQLRRLVLEHVEGGAGSGEGISRRQRHKAQGAGWLLVSWKLLNKSKDNQHGQCTLESTNWNQYAKIYTMKISFTSFNVASGVFKWLFRSLTPLHDDTVSRDKRYIARILCCGSTAFLFPVHKNKV